MTTAKERRMRTRRGRHQQVIIRDAFTHYTKSGKVKKTFLSEASAELAREVHGALSVYRCAQCGLWHTGS